tara:strand:- start:51 stop:278 length:228 start_codon:yes stop_codon:yes gene_type:complete
MIKYLITFAAVIGFAFASVYDVGDYISDTHQNITQSTCYAGNEYDTGDNWKLADWNGATNGDHHTVIFIEMSATW